MFLGRWIRQGVILIPALFIGLDLSASQDVESLTVDLAATPLRLKEVLQVALMRNPSIRAADEAYFASLARPPQVSALSDPRLRFKYLIEEIETGNGPMKGGLMISQTFPFPGKLSTKKEIAAKDAEIAKQRCNTLRIDLIFKVKSAYYDLYYLNKAIEITKQHKALLERFEEVARIKYTTGQAPQQGLLKCQVELSKLTNDLITLEETKETAVARLNMLLNRAPHSPLGDPPDFELPGFDKSLDDLYSIARRDHPELKARRYAIEKAKDSKRLAELKAYPDFGIGLEYTCFGTGSKMAPKEGKDTYAVTVSINLPIWIDKLRAGVREASSKIRASKMAYTKTENMVLFEIKDSYFKLETARRLVHLYETSIIPQAEQSLKISEMEYKAGKIDLLRLIDAQRILLHFNLSFERARSDYQKCLARLERAVGGAI